MICFKVIYSKRRSIAISIRPDSEVIVRAPLRTSLKTIENLVVSKSSWIRRHLENNADRIRINMNMEYIDGEYHFFGGRQYPLRVVHSGKNYVKNYDDVIEIGLKVKNEKPKAGILLGKWYKNRAEELLTKKLGVILYKYSRYNFSPTGFEVRTMKGRWGSCTSKGKITVSTELIKLDEKYSDYVIIHELCHLKYHNHSREFYQLLSDVYPEWKSVRTDLRKYIR